MSLAIHRPLKHKAVLTTQPALMRTPSPYFAPPVPAYMREPGTNYMSIIMSNDVPTMAKVVKPSQLPKRLRKK